MPTVFTHAIVGLGLAATVGQIQSPLAVSVSVSLAVLPDCDVIGFYLGVPYGSPWGHRGFSHSLCCAALVGLAAVLPTAAALAMPWWLLWAYCFVVMASHGILDGFTNGGRGVAYFAPFDVKRYFLPWRPIRVSFIGLNIFRKEMIWVLGSEVCWVWLPLALVVGLSFLWRT
jgi:inner membrane protein